MHINYNLEYFLDGQKGVARFVVDNILKDEDNNLKYLCTDASRSTFKYKDKLGNIQKDYEAKRLTNYLVEILLHFTHFRENKTLNLRIYLDKVFIFNF